MVYNYCSIRKRIFCSKHYFKHVMLPQSKYPRVPRGRGTVLTISSPFGSLPTIHSSTPAQLLFSLLHHFRINTHESRNKCYFSLPHTALLQHNCYSLSCITLGLIPMSPGTSVISPYHTQLYSSTIVILSPASL